MLNVAVYGLGWWGKLIVELLRDNDRLRVTRAVTGSASAYARANGIAPTADYDEVLRDPALDAVILCTPHSTHLEQVSRAAAAGKHVFCEKPLGLTRRDAVAAIAACNKHLVVLGVGHERRFEPPILEVRRMAEAGELGTLLQIEANFSQNKFLALPGDNWRLNASEAPAGPLTATGVHYLDLAVSFLGPAERVMVSVRQLASQLANGDTLGALVMFRSGANALISAILATPFVGRFALYGSNGWAEVVESSHPDSPMGWTLTTCSVDGRQNSTRYPMSSAVLANLMAFADAVEGRAAYPMPQDQMVATIAALEACFRSAASGHVETVEA